MNGKKRHHNEIIVMDVFLLRFHFLVFAIPQKKIRSKEQID